MSQNEKKGTLRKSYSSKKVVRRSPSCRTGDDGLDYSMLIAYLIHVYIGDVNMNMTSHGIVDIKGCQHSKHTCISISVFQTERFP